MSTEERRDQERREVVELQLRVSEMELREARLRHKIVVVSHAIIAFSDGTCVAKVPLTPTQSKWMQATLKAAKHFMPDSVRDVTVAVEKLAKLAYLSVDLSPLLMRLKEDVEAELQTLARERKQHEVLIRGLMARG